jgi:hypothetical protein
MGNAIIAFDNLLDYAGTVYSGGAWTVGLPLANIGNRQIGNVARSSNVLLASTQFQVALASAKLMRTVALIGHSFSLGAKVRIRLSTAPTSDYVHDSGWLDAWPVVYDTSNLEWESENWWSGTYTETERAGYTWNFIDVLDQAVLARYITVEIDDQGNAAGFVQLGRVFAADAWQTAVNMTKGASIGWEPRTQVDETISGAEYFNRRTPYRVARFNTDWMSIDEGYGNAFDLQRRVGIDKEVLFLYDPQDTIHALRRQFLGRLRQLSPIEQPLHDVTKTAWEIKELL